MQKSINNSFQLQNDVVENIFCILCPVGILVLCVELNDLVYIAANKDLHKVTLKVKYIYKDTFFRRD